MTYLFTLPEGWNPVVEMPEGRRVRVISVTGIETTARRPMGNRVRLRKHRSGPVGAFPRVNCFGPKGDLAVIGWKPLLSLAGEIT
jgi:hypothetical protein